MNIIKILEITTKLDHQRWRISGGADDQFIIKVVMFETRIPSRASLICLSPYA